VNAISPELARTPADTLVTEILPLLAASKFLEQNAEHILAVKRLGWRGLPLWLSGVDSEVHRVALGRVLVIGPSNYPLFLPGVQTLQALAAGNAVVWKPGRGGTRVAEVFAEAIYGAGLPRELLRITDDSVAAGVEALRAGVDKVIFTGSAESARQVMRCAADQLVPCVIEASGCDAVVVLPSADIERVVKALVFGLRLNGSATCMAPRRVLVVQDGTTMGQQRAELLKARLAESLKDVPPVELANSVRDQVKRLLEDAESLGAKVIGELEPTQMRPILVTTATVEMQVCAADVFAPILAIMAVDDIEGVEAAQQACPFGLTAAVFGEELAARRIAERLDVGTALINDVIISTADPRAPFGGRRRSGYGVTRGAEGLLGMTAVKVVVAQRNKTTRQYDAATAAHGQLFEAVIHASHAATWRQRWLGLRQAIRAMMKLKK